MLEPISVPPPRPDRATDPGDEPTTMPTLSIPRLALFGCLGGMSGAFYAAADRYLDTHGQESILSRPFSPTHDLVDVILPVLLGAALAIALYIVRFRGQRHAAAARHAEAIHRKLARVERDQAVWVMAAATLHELHTPMHAMGLLLDELAQLEPDDPNPGIEAERSHLIERARAQMNSLIDNVHSLKTVARSHAPDLGQIRIDTLIDAVVTDARAALPPGIELRVQSSPEHTLADPTYTRIVIENLVSNAIDAVNASGGQGLVTLVSEPSTEDFRLRISDSGGGIPERMRSTLFEPLNTSKPSGLGMGLAVARTLARSMGGDLSLAPIDKATPDQKVGTTFILKLRRAP